MSKCIYVAGPISKGDYLRNVRAAIEASERIKLRGHVPFTPHLTALWYFLFMESNSLDDRGWLHYNLTWLGKCDILVRLPGESKGADNEVEEARKLGMPVFFGMEELMKDPLWE